MAEEVLPRVNRLKAIEQTCVIFGILLVGPCLHVMQVAEPQDSFLQPLKKSVPQSPTQWNTFFLSPGRSALQYHHGEGMVSPASSHHLLLALLRTDL